MSIECCGDPDGSGSPAIGQGIRPRAATLRPRYFPGVDGAGEVLLTGSAETAIKGMHQYIWPSLKNSVTRVSSNSR